MNYYADNSTTTRMDALTVASMQEWLDESYGDAASWHDLGSEAARAVERARSMVATVIGANPSCLHFTSGGTESNNWVRRVVGGEDLIFVSVLEHQSVFEGCNPERLVWMGVNGAGTVDLDALDECLGEVLQGAGTPLLVCVQLANGEIGTMQDIPAVADVVHRHNAVLLCDACQAFGRVRFDVDDLGADYLTISAHKAHGPMGVGALWVREGVSITPFIHGEDRGSALRGGALNVPAIVGFGKAAQLCSPRLEVEPRRQHDLIESMWGQVRASVAGAIRLGNPEARLPGVLCMILPGVEGAQMVAQMDREGVAISCGVRQAPDGSVIPSSGLRALGLSASDVASVVTISISHQNEDGDCGQVASLLCHCANNLGKGMV